MEDCLVGQFLGASPPLSHIQAVVCQIWERQDKVDVMSLDNGFCLFKFENIHTRSWVLDRGH